MKAYAGENYPDTGELIVTKARSLYTFAVVLLMVMKGMGIMVIALNNGDGYDGGGVDGGVDGDWDDGDGDVSDGNDGDGDDDDSDDADSDDTDCTRVHKICCFFR